MKIQLRPVPRRIYASFDHDYVQLSTDFQQKINTYWQQLLKGGRDLYNGDVFYIDQITLTSEKLSMNLKQSTYKHYLYSVNHNLHHSLRCSSLFAAALIKTSDHYFAIGQMGEHTSTPNRLQCPGGGVEIDDYDQHHILFKQTIVRELLEEVNLDCHHPQHITKLYPAYIKTGGHNGNIAMMFQAFTPMSKNELEQHFLSYTNDLKSKGQNPELKKLLFIRHRRKDVENFLKERSEPVVDYLKYWLRCVAI